MRVKSLLAAAALMGLVAIPAHAATLQIQFSGFDVNYDGSLLCDATNCNAPPATPTFSDADPLITMSFLVDGVQVGSTLVGTDGIGADMELHVGSLACATPPCHFSGATAAAGDDNLDLYMFDTWGLALDVQSWDISINPGGPSPFQLTASATVADIFNQDLPYNLIIGTPVGISFSLNNISGDTSSFEGHGTGEVDGTALTPEPGSMLLLGTGLVGLGATIRRRLKKA